MEVRNRFKGLDLIECLMNYGWRFVILYRRQGSRPSPRKRMQKRKWFSEALQIAVKRREVKGRGEKERHSHLNAEFQRIARRNKKAFIRDQGKEIEKNNRMGKARDLFKKIRDTKGTFHAKIGTIKDRNGMHLKEAEDIKKKWHEYTLLLLLSRFSRVRLCATPQMAAHQAPPSLGFSRQEHWNGLPFPPPMHESEK